MTIQTTRRAFMKGAVASGAVLMVGFDPKGVLAAGSAGAVVSTSPVATPDGMRSFTNCIA